MTLYAYDRLADEAWARLEKACDDPAHPMHLLVLSTVAVEGTPESRLMVLRGANRRLGRLWFYTDRRSAKVEHLRGCSTVCVLGYDRGEGVQLRIMGNATVHEGDDPVADEHWHHASMAVQAIFASPDPPGRPLRQPDPRLMGMKRSLDAGYEEAARGNFAVIDMAIESVEWLQVENHDQRRAIMLSATGWTVHPLAP